MKYKPRDDFYSLADEILALRSEGEEMRLGYEGERSDFIRFNGARIRQPGTVEQSYLTVELIAGRRHSSAKVALSKDRKLDRERLDRTVAGLREKLETLPEDPHLILPDDPRSTEQMGEDRLPDAKQAVSEILEAASGTDFVGIYAGGEMQSGFASSLGQRSWFSSHSFNLDFSLYAREDKAIKESLAGFDWSSLALQEKISAARGKLAILDRPVKDISPGKYRVYLAPAAMEEIISQLSWDGFGLRSHRSKTTSLIGLIEGESSLAPGITLTENTEEGVGPSFDDQGFVKPKKVELIEGGELEAALVSPRSAVEYGVPTNAAASTEHPMALEMAPGEIPREEIPTRLGEGIYIGNLWYLNYSNRKTCRMTGMTRFGTFWVEGGEIARPIPAMRFDESLYSMLGENLEGLTKERDLIIDPSTYFSRSTRSAKLPGALVRDFTFTL